MSCCCVGVTAQLHHLLDSDRSLFRSSFAEILVLSFPLSLRIPADLTHDVGPQATLPRPLRHLNDPDGLLQTQDAHFSGLKFNTRVLRIGKAVWSKKEMNKKSENIFHTLLVSPPFRFGPVCWREAWLAPAALYAVH